MMKKKHFTVDPAFWLGYATFLMDTLVPSSPPRFRDSFRSHHAELMLLIKQLSLTKQLEQADLIEMQKDEHFRSRIER